MDVKKKLAELIESARYWGSNTSEETADNLIANGVTVQEWVSSDDPPKENGDYFCFCSTYKNINRLTWCDGMWLFAYAVPVNNVTHWMPLPKPPKGE